MSTVALFDFQEISDSVRPVDSAENLTDLTDDPSTTPTLDLPPVAVSPVSGRGRQFDDDVGLIGTEVVADSLRLTRNCTIRAFVRYRIDNATAAQISTVVIRGFGTGAAERRLFGMELVQVTATTATLRARWSEIGGGAASVTGVTIDIDPDEFYEFVIIRSWVDTTAVNLTYIVNGTVVGTEVVAEGDIGEGTGGTLTVGAAHDGTAVYERFLPTDSIIDSLSIENDAMSPEEVRQEFRRITIHQPNGYRVLRGYLPPGETYSHDPDSRIQRWVASEGDALGFALAQAEKLREDILPDRAYGEMLAQWEALVGLSPGPTESVADRRTAVLSFLRKTLGFPVEDIKTGLELAFGLDAADIEIFEFTGLRTDDFSTDDIGSPPSKIWITNQGNGTVAIVAGACEISSGAGVDVRYPSASPTRLASVTGRTTEDNTDGVTLISEITINSLPILAQDVIVGHLWRAAGDAAVIGFRFNSGAHRIFYAEVVSGVISTPIDLSGATVTSPQFLLTRYNHVAQTITAEWATTRAALDGAGTDQATSLVNPLYAGFGAFGLDASVGDAFDLDFDDFEIWEPDSPRGHIFFAFRDPGLGGTYNLNLAQQQLDKQSPAHSFPVAIDDKDGFTLGPAGVGRLGLDPLFPSGI